MNKSWLLVRLDSAYAGWPYNDKGERSRKERLSNIYTAQASIFDKTLRAPFEAEAPHPRLFALSYASVDHLEEDPKRRIAMLCEMG